MSAVAGLYNVPSTRAELDTWGFQHAAHHRDINRLIFEALGITVPEYVLDPIDPHDSGVWRYQHQAMHSFMDAILGISGYNLLSLDWNNEAILGGWIYLNASEHYQAAHLLGIG